MNMQRVIPIVLICFFLLITTGCVDQSIVKDNDSAFTELLITKDDLPNPEAWYVYDIGEMVFHADRLPEEVIAFYSDRMLNSGRAIEEYIYLFDSVEEAEGDYSKFYSQRTTYNYFFSDGWTFTHPKADENYIVCSEVNDNPYCTWVGRYRQIIIEFSTFLIPERMTLDDMNRIVKEIDGKASELISDNY